MEAERKVTQLDEDVREIYGLLRGLRDSVDGLQRASAEQRGMIQRQGNRLDSLEANVAQLAEDVAEVRGDVATLKTDVHEIKNLIESFLMGFNQTPDE